MNAPATTRQLFEQAFAVTGPDSRGDFPYAIEAQLDELHGAHEWMRDWDAYVAAVIEGATVAQAVAA